MNIQYIILQIKKWLLLGLLFVSSISVKAQEEPNWIFLESKDNVSLFYAIDVCEDGQNYLCLKAENQNAIQIIAEFELHILDGGKAKTKTIKLDVLHNDSGFIDCISWAPHQLDEPIVILNSESTSASISQLKIIQ